MFNKVEKKSKRKESHHHFEEAKCVRCGITISEVQSVFCREKNKDLENELEDAKLVKSWVHNGKEWKEEMVKSTPEEKEEWEEDFRGFLDFVIEDDSNKNEVVEKVKQLLSERERWAIDTFLKDTASYNSFHNGRPRTMRNGLSGEGFEVRVSKLSKKK